MERITKWAFRNKAAVIVCVILVLVMGVVSYLTLPKEFLPDMNQPNVTVTVMGQGFDAATMADEVVTPIEQAVGTVKGKAEVLSTSSDGYAQISISFDSKTSMKDAKAEVQDALSGVTLPQGVSRPNVVNLNASMIPIADVALTFQNGITDQSINTVKDDIVPMFQGVKGVASASVYGENLSQVVVHLDKDKMAQARIPLQAVMGVLQGQNLTAAVADTTINGQSSSVKVIGQIDGLQKLGDLNVVPTVKLSEIASITLGDSGQSITHVDGKPAVLVVVTKSADSNAVTVGSDVRKMAAQVDQKYSPAIHASVPYATADMVNNSVNSMMREVLMGALFATIVILLFLRSIRMTLITVVSIPLSLGLTLFLLSESGITLNILTLGAVAVAVGRLVDDSIVVIENIYRKAQLEGYKKEVIIQATKEVATAITASTLTTVAVFLPMGLIQGAIQQMLLPFALTIVYSLLSSLVVALVVVPLMSAGLLKNAKLRDHKRPQGFVKFITWTLNHKWVPITLAVLIFGGAMGAYFTMPKAAIDSSDQSFVNVSLNYPGSTSFDQVKAGAEKLEQFIASQPETKTTLMILGNSEQDAKLGQLQSPTLANINVIMKNGANTNHFIDEVNSQKSQYATADLSAFANGGFGGGNTIQLDLSGNNPQTLLTASTSIIGAVKNIDGVQKVTSNEQDIRPTYEIHVNPSVGNAQDIATQLRAVLNQVPMGTILENGKDTTVVLDSTANPASLDDLNKIMIGTKSGVVPLESLATLTKVDKPATILKKDGHEFVRVNVQVDPKKLSTVNHQVTQATSKVTLPSGVTLNGGGAITQQSSQFADLYKTMLIAIGIVYLIMVLTFKTLRAPLAILFTLPLAAVGAVVGLMVSRTPADPTSVIGMLMLVGIVVTNAIVLIDKVKQNEQQMTIRDAIVDATATRMRPIVMTAVATICAMLPLLFSKSQTGSLVSKGLASVVIGGLSVATLLTLVVIPVVYELFHFRKAKKQRKEAAMARTTATAQPAISR
jgi:multidrug efflux pump subunit AcrB